MVAGNRSKLVRTVCDQILFINVNLLVRRTVNNVCLATLKIV
jgi:hypothetical protein